MSTHNTELLHEAVEVFRSRFPEHAAAKLCFGSAPGRIEVLGNHTDYNDGFVLSAAIDRRTVLVGTPVDSDNVSLYSQQMKSTVAFPATDSVKYEHGSLEAWANYPKGVILELNPTRGFVGVFCSSIPLGAGVSSSAALELATAMFIRAAFPQSKAARHNMIEIALACKHAENAFVGMGCGILDQFTSAMSREGHLLFLDCRDIAEYRYIPIPPEYKFVVAESEAQHQLLDGKYNELRSQCFEAARLLHKPSLRDVTYEQFQNAAALLPEDIRRRVSHIVGENERVQRAIKILESHRPIQELGELLLASHRSSQFEFKNSCQELDILVECAQSLPGFIGARLQGGGFGGSTINLVESSMVEMFTELLSKAYFEKTGIFTNTFVVTPSDGASCGSL